MEGMGLTRWLLKHGGDGTYPLAINSWWGWDLPAGFFNMEGMGLTCWLLYHGGDGTYPLASLTWRGWDLPAGY
jgi:hypothetical protein